MVMEWIRKNKKHKNKSIGFLPKFVKINRYKNIQIYSTSQNMAQIKFLSRKDGQTEAWVSISNIFTRLWEQ